MATKHPSKSVCYITYKYMYMRAALFFFGLELVIVVIMFKIPFSFNVSRVGVTWSSCDSFPNNA